MSETKANYSEVVVNERFLDVVNNDRFLLDNKFKMIDEGNGECICYDLAKCVFCKYNNKSRKIYCVELSELKTMNDYKKGNLIPSDLINANMKSNDIKVSKMKRECHPSCNLSSELSILCCIPFNTLIWAIKPLHGISFLHSILCEHICCLQMYEDFYSVEFMKENK